MGAWCRLLLVFQTELEKVVSEICLLAYIYVPQGKNILCCWFIFLSEPDVSNKDEVIAWNVVPEDQKN